MENKEIEKWRKVNRLRKLSYGKPKRLIILKKIKYLRRWLLRNPWIRPICVFNYAAIRIQQIARRYLIRKFGRGKKGLIEKEKKEINRKELKRNNNKNNVKNSKKKPSKNQQLDKYLVFIELVQSNETRKPVWLDGGYSSWCAVRIQSVWRMFKTKRRVRNSKRLVLF